MNQNLTDKEWMVQRKWGGIDCNPLPTSSLGNQKQIQPLDVPAVTEEDIASFEAKGYWVGPKILCDEDVAILRKEVYRIYEGEVDTDATPYEYNYWKQNVLLHRKGSKDVKKINNGWWINSTIKSLVLSPVIGKIAADLLKTDEIRMWHDQVITKPGIGAGSDDMSGNIGWHQDYAFWQLSDTPCMVTAWIALQDTNEVNGTLMTITSSNKWGLVPDSAQFFDRNLSALEEKFRGNGEWLVEPAILKAGQVVFHHSLTFHGSGPNNTDEDRLAIAIHMQSEKCAYRAGYGNHHNLRDLGPNAKTGDLFVGPAFPVLYHRENK